jgi:hypothetical protein
MEKVGGKQFYKGDDVIPVLFDMEHIYRNKKQYDWLTYQNSSDNRAMPAL